MEKELYQTLKLADQTLFEIYSNAQKFTWQEIEELANDACKKTKEVLDKYKDLV